MPIDFPNSPSVGSLYTVDDRTWRWDGFKWSIYATGISKASFDTKGDMLVGTGNDEFGKLPVGTINQFLTVNSGASVGVAWSSTLTSPTIASATLTSPTINAGLLNFGTKEKVYITGAGCGASVGVYWNTFGNITFTNLDSTAATTAVYVGYDSSHTQTNATLAIGESITLGLIIRNGGTIGCYPTSFWIDGVSQTVRWVNATTPSSGNLNSWDSYTYTILKTAASTYTVLGSRTRFA